MTDVLTRRQRSYCMSRIRSKNTRPEIILRKAISKTGIRGYRLNCGLSGKPDIVFPKRKIVIFIDGCFWHKCPKCFKSPKTNKKFWLEKIEGNKRRDIKVNRHYKKMGWRIIRIWEHDLKKKDFRFDPKKIK